jgi:hypothetical protein
VNKPLGWHLTGGITRVILLVMKTAISIPDDLYRAAERAAKRLGLSRSELYRRALGAFLDRHSDKLVTQALDEVYVEGSGVGRLDPALGRMQSASFPDDEW